MKITFLGAARTVTGSNFLVEAAGKKFLVDCGMYQGKITEQLENSDPFIYNVNNIDFMLLTHAHIDHSGRIPKLYNEGFKGPVYATKATCDLCEIMLPDSGHIQEVEIEWKNRKRMREGLEALPPLYTAQDAIDCLEIFHRVQYDEIVEIDDNISVRFNDAGHMLGSAIIEIWATENGKTTKAVFTGDLGNNDLPLLDSPTMISNADYLIMESTYGNRLHMRNDDKAKLFLDIVSETLDKGGRVVIPSFAVGRTQEILYEIDKLREELGQDEEFARKYEKLMNVPVYVDSPLAIAATEVFKKNTELFEEEIQEKIKRGDNPLEFRGLQFTPTADESKALNEDLKPKIIISASGMCEVGRIKHHLKHNLYRPECTILFVGYQAEGTLGRKIMDGQKLVKLFGDEIAVNAEIKYLDAFSGHADKEGLLNWIYHMDKKPKNIFLVHGEYSAQQALRTSINERFGINAIIPAYEDTYTDDGNMIQSKNVAYKSTRFDILETLAHLKEDVDNMSNTVKAELKNNVETTDLNELMLKLSEVKEAISKLKNN